tara:strand:+ start:1041 stop:1337 length:297 start_codon:yes stop_codon:yes gene_type:complete
MKNQWNNLQEPISERLRNADEILRVVNEKTMMYNKNSGDTAIISEVFIVDQDEHSIKEGYTIEEDRWVEYITSEGPKENFSVDLDEDNWVWHDELETK